VPLYDNTSSVCGIVYDDTPFYFQKNLQGDIIEIVDKNAEVVAKYSYDAWGECTILQDSSNCHIASLNPYRYRGYYYDAEIGLYYLQSRYYDPSVGRFISADKYMGANSDIAAYDLYSYCGNAPVKRRDKGGFSWIEAAWEGIKKVFRASLNLGNLFLVGLGVDTAGIGATLLNMFEEPTDVYHANFDCWQQVFGYNDIYDFMFDIGTSMDNEKFEFEKRGKKYVLWAWKGNYINLGAGAELGIYYGGPLQWFVDKSLAMDMTMKLRYRGRQIIDYSARTWWITGFHSKYLCTLESDLTVSFIVTFNNWAMFKAFKEGPRGKEWYYPCSKKYKAIYSF